MFTHGALIETCQCVPDRIGIWNWRFLRRGEKRSTRRKTSRILNPPHGVDARILTPGHIGGRLVLSPLRHPLLPNERRCGSITRSVTSSATTTKTNTRTAKTRTTKTQRPFRVCKSSLTLFTPRFNYLYTIVVVCGWLPVVTNQVKPLKQYYCTDDC